MKPKILRALALRVAYHLEQKLGELHQSPLHTLVMMVTAFLVGGEPCLSDMARNMAELPGSVQDKVSRMSRFLSKSRFELTEAFHLMARRIIETVAHAHDKGSILVSMDWTDLGKYMGLWLSLPYQGRALPLSCVVLEKESSEDAMTCMEVELVERFLKLFPPELRDRIVILADRGFAKRELFVAIKNLGAHFAIRMQRNRQIRTQGTWIELQDLRLAAGQTLILRGVEYMKENPFLLHVAVRRLAVPRAKDPDDDVWYIATDLEEIDQALFAYTRRFSCEEMFRDLKSRLHMDRHHLGTEESVGKMMLVVALAYLILLEDGNQWRGKIDLARIVKNTPWGQLSVFRIAQTCFWLFLPEAPSAFVEETIIAHWMRRRAA